MSCFYMPQEGVNMYCFFLPHMKEYICHVVHFFANRSTYLELLAFICQIGSTSIHHPLQYLAVQCHLCAGTHNIKDFSSRLQLIHLY